MAIKLTNDLTAMNLNIVNSKICLLLAFVMLLIVVTGCHTNNKSALVYDQLDVGDQVPDFELSNLINYPKSTASISDFRGKLVILDFWTTGCAGCVLQWPKLLSLQEKFEDRLQIVLVNDRQDSTTIRKAFERRRKIAGINMTLPTLYNDTIAQKLFPHQGVPFVAWISPDGKVLGLTDGVAVQQTNIESILAGEEVAFHRWIDRDKTIPYDYSKPMFVDGNGGQSKNLLWHSMLTASTDSLQQVMLLRTDSLLGYYATAVDRPIIDLYRMAYSDRSHWDRGTHLELPLSRVILEVKDSKKYVERTERGLNYDNFYNYQLTSPPVSRERLQKAMQIDLDKYFGLKAEWQKRKVKCLVLRTQDSSRVTYKSGEEAFLVGDGNLYMNQIPMKRLMYDLEYSSKYYISPYPLIDDTHIKGLIGGIKEDFVDVEDPDILNKALQKYGMSFTLEERVLDMLVIREEDYLE